MEFDGIFDIPHVNTTVVPGKVVSAEKQDIEINAEFAHCMNIMSNSSKNLYITGEAGSGKSTILKHFIKNTKKSCVVLAPTGVAAVRVGGQTIHSFFGFPPKPLSHNNIPTAHGQKMPLYRRVDTILIDEASMVRADMLDAIDMFLRFNLNDERPFAGKQVVLFGDLAQLPPVIGTSAEQEMMQYEYGGSPYFFSSHAFTKAEFTIVVLNTVYRQRDPMFLSLLNKMRTGDVSQSDIDIINDACLDQNCAISGDIPVICTVNIVADNINKRMIQMLPGDEWTLIGKIDGEFNPKSCPVDEIINVKKGAKIMLLTNDSAKRWYNGTMAKLLDIKSDHLVIEIDGVSHKLEKYTYEFIKYKYNHGDKSIAHTVTGTFIQYPIKIGYAFTIHKVQGLTMTNVLIDMDNGAFAHGQTYVALSRCTELKGIKLRKRINISDIIIDSNVAEFNRTLLK